MMKPYRVLIQFEFNDKECADKHIEELKQMAYESLDDFDFKIMTDDFTWDDVVADVTDLIRINTIDTMESDDHYSIDDISEVMSREYDMIKENLDQDTDQVWSMIHDLIERELMKKKE